jgi:exonuclease SbcD
MKLLHTSDWHLGKRLNDFSRHEEQEAVMAEICDIAQRENVDAVLVAGDLFDTFNPPTEAVELLYRTLKRLSDNGKRAVIAIAGNHDSPDRIEAPDPLARECGIIFAGYPNSKIPCFELESGLKVINSSAGFIELKLPNCADNLRLLLTPYANELRLKTFLGAEDSELALRETLSQAWKEKLSTTSSEKSVNVLLTHLFIVKEGAEQPLEPEDEKPILFVGGAQAIYSSDIPDNVQYAALGHLHRKQIIDTKNCPVVYSGSPLEYSFSEANQQKYCILVEVEADKQAMPTEIPLTAGKKLHRKQFEDIDLAVNWLTENPDTLVELTIRSTDYLSAIDRKRLYDAHSGIITLIPELIKNQEDTEATTNNIDLSKNMEELFVDFFKKQKKNQEPNERLLNLFKEIVSEEKA